jgi:hypothetical protein
MAVTSEVTELLETFENGSANVRSRLSRAIAQLRALAEQRGWADRLPRDPVEVICGIDQAGAEAISLPPGDGVLVHVRFGYFGDVPGTEQLLVLLLGESGELLDEFRCWISTAHRMAFRRPWFQPTIEREHSGGVAVVVRVGLRCPWFRLAHRGRVVEVEPVGPHGQASAERHQEDGLCRFAVSRSGFVLVSPELSGEQSAELLLTIRCT